MKLLAILFAGTLLLSACGSSAHRISVDIGPRPVVIRPPSPTALRFSTASNRRLARENAGKLLGILALPDGARTVARLPQSTPSRFKDVRTGTRFLQGIAVEHRIWVVHEPVGRVFRFVRAHARPRPRPLAQFRGENNGVRFRRMGTYAFPPIPGRSWERWLNVDMIALSGRRTVVIGQAGDAWVHTPPRGALLPAHVKRIDVVSRAGAGAPNVLVHIRQKYDVASIVSELNGLGLADAVRIACAWDRVGGPVVTLRFRTANGKLLARATLPDPLGSGRAGPCTPLELTVHGRKAPPRIGSDLLLRVQQLLDVDLAPPLPRDVSACLLRGHGWEVRPLHRTPRELTARNNGRRWTITFHATGRVTLDKPGPRALERCIRARPRQVIFR